MKKRIETIFSFPLFKFADNELHGLNNLSVQF